jgi:GMP synthase-like glutamine amidotransferase
MRLAILRTGQTNAAIRASFPDYPDLYENLLNTEASRIKGAFSFTSFAVFKGEMPADPDKFDGYIITGSAAGVYEEHDWLKPLFAFIKKCDLLKKPLCGICFGHQAIAKALGGEVVKWADGWGVGVQDMRITAQVDWMPKADKMSLIYFHQDQVTQLPEGAKNLAANEFCAIGAFAKARHIFCLQGHPEFPADYSAALLEAIRKKVGDSRTDAALSSLAERTDAQEVAQWIANFFLQAYLASADKIPIKTA